MAVTDQQVLQWFQDNPNATDAQIAQAAAAAGVSASQLSRVTGVPVSEVVSRVEATGSTIQPNDYFAQNPDVATAYAQNSYGMTPEQFATTHYQIYGANEQRAAPTDGVVSDTALKNWIDSNAGATTGQLYTAALNQGIGLDQIQRVSGLSTQDLLASQILSTSDSSKWSGEGWGSAEKNAADMAKILAGVGITDLNQFGEIKQTVQGDPIYGGPGDDPVLLGYGPDREITTYGNKETGQALANTYGERQTGNAWGGTYAGEGNTAYRVQFDASGNPVFYTTGASSSDIGSIAPLLAIGGMLAAPWLSGQIGALTGLTGAGLSAATGATLGAGTAALTDNDILKGALLGGGAGYLGNTLFGGGNTTDLGMNSDLTMAQIESGLGTEGYGVGAQATQSGLFDPSVIGSGAYTQTSYPYDMSEFLAADAQNLYSQVGSNIPAIEQNLVASGVDPLVAADVANQITLNPNISTYDLTNYINTSFNGGNLYDVNTATQYPTSVLKDTGGLLTDIPANTTATVSEADYSNEGRNYPTTESTQGAGGSPVNASTAAAATGLTASQIANLIKAGAGLLGAGAAVNNMGGTGGVGALPTQGVPTGNQDYYNAIQQYYNAYMPAAPRDVATPLQNWYNSKYGA